MSKAKVCTADANTVLSEAAILHHLFSFLPGHWLYLGAVCRAWMLSYKRAHMSEICIAEPQRGKKVVCGWCTTLLSAVFQSPSRLRLARDSGVRLSGYGIQDMQFIAGLCADVPTLRLAEDLGMALSASTVKGAACSDRASIVQYLIGVGQCSGDSSVAEYAVHSGNVDILKGLRRNNFEFYSRCCTEAATAGQLGALQFVLSFLSCACSSGTDGLCALCGSLKHVTLPAVAKGGYIEIVQWLQQQPGVEVSEKTMSSAASGGHITIMCISTLAAVPMVYYSMWICCI
jgi:hypothetical protein